MTKLDELVSFILSDKLKEIRNYCCYDELVSEAKKLQREQVKNITYEPLLTPVIYKQSFIDRFNKYFEYKPKTYEYIGKNSKRRYTLNDLHKEYEKAMGETPFNRG